MEYKKKMKEHMKKYRVKMADLTEKKAADAEKKKEDMKNFLKKYPRPEYKHKYYDVYKKEFQNIKNMDRMKREEIKKRIEKREEFIENVIKQQMQGNLGSKWKKAKNQKQADFKESIENKKLFHYKWLQKQKKRMKIAKENFIKEQQGFNLGLNGPDPNAGRLANRGKGLVQESPDQDADKKKQYIKYTYKWL
jgi:hypothetical protein